MTFVLRTQFHVNSMGLLRDCTTGCGTDGAVHSTSCIVLFSHLGSPLLAAWQHNVQAFTWIQMQLWHCVMITIYNLDGHEIVKLDTTITQC